MSDNVIHVENLSKSYVLSHQSGGKGGHYKYQRFSDALIKAASTPFRALQGKSDSSPSHETFWALNDVSFDLKRGEVLGVIGRNGAGKSTLLKILSRITEPTSGRVEINGRIASLLEVGTGFHPELTGRENIYLNGAILGMKRAEIKKKFDEIVAFAEVEKFLDTPVKHYSSGMYVRLAFSVAAHLEPEILIIDEVLAVGDAQFQKKCLGKMQSVSGKDGRTVIFVSHQMATIANLCTKGIYLKNGQIAFSGDCSETIERYINDGNHDLGERTWPTTAEAPGSEQLRFRAVRITSEGKKTGQVSIDKEVCIEIDFINQIAGTQVSLSIHVFDQLGTTVLATANFPSASLKPDPWFNRAYPVGLYRARCTIPANFLNEGKYRLSAFLLTNVNHIEAQVDDVVAFTVHDTGEMRREYSGHWIGVVRPKLDWQTEPLKASS